jgi:hypothetical protein
MAKAIIGIAVLFSARSLAAQGEQAFKGACVKAGAKYVLSIPETKAVYKLDGGLMKPEAFAGQNVLVIGTLDEAIGTIHVDDMMGALPAKVMQAVLVYVDCVDCPRGMAAAKKAALREVADWKRFYLVPDRRRANLIFLFSARPYLGDYITRDGDHPGPTPVEVTYMNIIDPRTGESLWGDSRKWGSWFVGSATKDLIHEFRLRVDAEEGRFEGLLSFDKDHNRKAAPNEGK